ncbi:MAG: hypothetical protein KGL39_21740, partial [Patescibacteria group bacterium]|nr:hypothetical protein [Patescibacteria group bacterium]
MKKLIATILLFVTCKLLFAANVSFTFTNAANQFQPDTNDFFVYPVSDPSLNSDGSFYTTGIGMRIKNPTGTVVTNLAQGFYEVTNRYLGPGYVIQTPLDNGPTVYPSGDLIVPSSQGGINYFITRIISGGTNGIITQNQVTNAIGFLPASLAQITNTAQAVTNGFTSIVYSNPTAFTSFEQVTNIATNAAASAAQAATNGLIIPSTNGFISSANLAPYLTTNLANTLYDTNGAALAAAKAATNGLVIPATNGFISDLSQYATTNQDNARYDTNGAAAFFSKAATNGLSIPSTNGFISQNDLSAFANTNLSNLRYDTNGAAIWQARAATNGLNIPSTNGFLSAADLASYATTNQDNQRYDTNGAGAFFAKAATNGLTIPSTNGFIGQSDLAQYSTTNQDNARYDTNGAAAFFSKAATNGLSIPSTNGFISAQDLAQYANTNQSNSRYDTNGAAAYAAQVATNGLIIPQTNGFISVVDLSGYSTTNLSNIRYDTNGAALAAFNSATNFIAQSASTNYVNTATNTIWSVTTNYVNTHQATGFANTNLSNLSTYGSNVIISLSSSGAATNAIGNLNGTGTNTSLLGVTMINSNDASYSASSKSIQTFIYGTVATGGFGNTNELNSNGVNWSAARSALLAGDQNHFIVNGTSGEIDDSAIIGGVSNQMESAYPPSSIKGSVIIGGYFNTNRNGSYSVLIGSIGGMNNSHSFLWNDGLAPVSSGADNQFVIYATNGVDIGTNQSSGFDLNVSGVHGINSHGGYFQDGIQIGGGATNGITAATATNIITSMTNGLASLSYVTNYANYVSNSLAGQIQGGFADTNLSNLSTSGSNTILSLAGLLPPYAFDAANSYTNTYGGKISQLGISVRSGTVGPIGDYSAAFGASTADGAYSFAAGDSTASGGISTAFGNGVASGDYSMAVGSSVGMYAATASGNASFAFGPNANASNSFSFAISDGSQSLFGPITNNQMSILESNGISINTNNSAGYSVNVHGGVNIDDNYYINGTPVQNSSPGGLFINQQSGIGTNTFLFGTNFISGSYFFSQGGIVATNVSLMVSGYYDTNSMVNGVYLPVTNNPYVSYSNSLGGGFVISKQLNGGIYFVGSNQPFSQLSGPFSSSTPVFYTYGNQIGAYMLYGGSPTNGGRRILVSIYTNLIQSWDYSVAINTNSAGTNTLEVNGWVDSTKGFSVNGIPVGTNSVPPNLITNNYGNGIYGVAPTFSGAVLQNTGVGTFSINHDTGSTNTWMDSFYGLRVQPDGTYGHGYQFLNPGSVSKYDIAGENTPLWLDAFESSEGNQGILFEHAFGDSGNVNGSVGAAVSDFGLHGGTGSALEGLPASPESTASALPLPPFVLTTWWLADGANTNEQATTNMMALVAQSGLIAAVTNAGLPFILHVDENGQYISPHRATNGQITINTVNWPDGTNFASIVHSYGLKFMPTIYTFEFPTNEVDVYSLGLSNGYPAYPAMTPNTVDLDISKLIDFGADGVRVADYGFYSSGAILSMSRLIADAVLSPQNLAGSKPKLPYGTQTSQAGKGMTSPLFTEMLTPYFSLTPPEMMGECNIVEHDANGFPGEITSSIPEVNWMQNWRGAFNYEMPFRGRGHYGWASNGFITGDQSVGDTRLNLTMNAIGLSKVMFAFLNTNAPLASVMPNFLANATNANFLSIMADPLCNPTQKLFDNGPTNTSAWFRRLDGGAYAVALVNETAAN